MKRFLFLLLLPLSFLTQISAQGIDFFHGSWEEALAEAARQEKVIFVDAYAVWCGPCKRMAKNVFTNERVGDFYNANFINVKMDMERGEGLTFRKKYPVTAFPTLFYISAQGEVVYTTKGARGVDQFIQLGQQVLGSYDESPQYAKRYEAGERDPELIYDYVKALNEAGKPSLKISNEYLDGLSAKELLSDFNLRFILEAAVEADSRIFDMLVENRDAIAMLTSEQEVRDQIEEACANTVDKAIEFKAYSLVEEAKAKMAEYYPEAAKGFNLQADMTYALSERDGDTYVKSAMSYSKTEQGKKAEEMHKTANRIAKEFPAHEKAMKLAAKLAKKAAKADPTTRHKVTYAYLLDQNGNTAKAIKVLEKAIAEPDTSTDRRTAEQLLERLKNQ